MPPTLLLADDSLTIQRVIELTFADEDITVVAVSNGDQAISAIEADPPDIVLADVGMPGKTGYDVAEFIKQSPRLGHIPIVLLTAAFEPLDQERAERVGCAGVLQKPFEPQFVIGLVKDLLARSTGGKTDRPVRAPRPVPAGNLNDAPDPSANLDDYFDRLGVAFANMESGPAPGTQDASASLPPGSPGSPDIIDWFETTDPSPATLAIDDFSLADHVPPLVAWPAPPTPGPALAPALSGALADAFTHLLAAEQGQPPPAAAPSWPGIAPAAPIDTDAIVERISRRLLDRLLDGVVRDAVVDIVSNMAERLVREEIDRIKSADK